jgi:hypothetical protein
MCLVKAALSDPERYARAYLVLGGPSWKLRDFYTDGGLIPFLLNDDLVSILALEAFVATANRSSL